MIDEMVEVVVPSHAEGLMRSAMVVVVMLLTIVVAAPHAGSTLAASGTQPAMLAGQNDTGIWVLKDAVPSQSSPAEAPDSCYNSHEVTVSGLSATTFAKCSWPSPPVDVWNQTQHSWSMAPPQQLSPGETLQITSTVSTEGTYRSNGLSGGGSSWVRIDLVPGGGPYPGAVWAGVYEGDPANSAVSEFSIPSGSDGSLMLVSLSFSGPGGSGATTYTYQWQGPDGTAAQPPPTTGSPATVTAPAAEPEGHERCLDEGEDAEARFSVISKVVEVFPESDPGAIYSAKPNSVLNVCDHVMTGEDSHTIITFSDLSTLMVGAESEIIIASPGLQSSRIDVRKGSLWLDFKKAVLGDAIEIRSNLAVTGIKGTTIVLEVSDGADVLKVIEGEVEFTSLTTGQTAAVFGGETISATSDGLSDTTTFDVAAESKLWEQDLDAVDQGSSKLGSLAVVGTVGLLLAIGGWWAVSRRRTRTADTTAPPARAISPVQPAGWFTDPAGKHQLRYWDGSTWTANVSDSGQATTDPL